MEIKNMERLPDKAQKALKPYTEKMVEILGDDVISIFAYGSVTGPGYDPRRSDINIAVVMRNNSIQKLEPSLKMLRAGLKKKITVPLFLTPAYINMSLDTFPIEFLGMKESCIVLFGEDILSGVEVKNEDLRRECEYQLKGKLLTLRQAYLEQALKRRALEKLIKISLRALFPVFRGALRIKREGIPPID